MSEIDVPIEIEIVSSPSAGGEPKSDAIEEDLKDLLPSVKNLAIAFATDINKVVSEKLEIAENGVEQSVLSPAADSYVPQYNNTYHPAAPPSATVNATSTIENGSSGVTNNEKGDIVRPRSKSPIPAAANLRSSIAFFENLKK